ncbi:MAG: aminopeptidase [Verrucomicrobia bacterium]|nr:MAG: aminopeptidase [Verrucomicrobiota bacterium]
MNDPRYDRLADVLTGHSTRLEVGDHVLINALDIPDEMVIALVHSVRSRRAVPHVQVNRTKIDRVLAMEATEDQVRVLAGLELQRMRKMDAYIAVRGSGNIFETSDVPPERARMISRLTRRVQDHRINHTKWVGLRWPSPAMAQQAMMSTQSFEDHFFRVCTLDYSRMTAGMNALNRLMSRTDRVTITGPGTDLSFSIKGIGAISCGGSRNIPDGEVFSCPVRNSVEGAVQYNVPSLYRGTAFQDIRLVFKKGRIVDATSNQTGRLNEILDADPGARYVGEFSLGFNPHIREPILDTLFDEKIAGSFHFTPGQAYTMADNGNRSQVHWDLVCIQRPDYGGGEVRFDGKLIRKDGLFVPASLRKLNPEYLIGSDR